MTSSTQLTLEDIPFPDAVDRPETQYDVVQAFTCDDGTGTQLSQPEKVSGEIYATDRTGLLYAPRDTFKFPTDRETEFLNRVQTPGEASYGWKGETITRVQDFRRTVQGRITGTPESYSTKIPTDTLTHVAFNLPMTTREGSYMCTCVGDEAVEECDECDGTGFVPSGTEYTVWQLPESNVHLFHAVFSPYYLALVASAALIEDVPEVEAHITQMPWFPAPTYMFEVGVVALFVMAKEKWEGQVATGVPHHAHSCSQMRSTA